MHNISNYTILFSSTCLLFNLSWFLHLFLASKLDLRNNVLIVKVWYVKKGPESFKHRHIPYTRQSASMQFWTQEWKVRVLFTRTFSKKKGQRHAIDKPTTGKEKGTLLGTSRLSLTGGFPVVQSKGGCGRNYDLSAHQEWKEGVPGRGNYRRMINIRGNDQKNTS